MQTWSEGEGEREREREIETVPVFLHQKLYQCIMWCMAGLLHMLLYCITIIQKKSSTKEGFLNEFDWISLKAHLPGRHFFPDLLAQVKNLRWFCWVPPGLSGLIHAEDDLDQLPVNRARLCSLGRVGHQVRSARFSLHGRWFAVLLLFFRHQAAWFHIGRMAPWHGDPVTWQWCF